MTRWLRSLPALPEDPCSVPSTASGGWFVTTSSSDSSSRGANPLLCTPWAPAMRPLGAALDSCESSQPQPHSETLPHRNEHNGRQSTRQSVRVLCSASGPYNKQNQTT